MRIILTLLFLSSSVFAETLVHEFHNPSFSGIGYSQHVLSVDQLQNQRKQQVTDDAKSAAAQAERIEKNKLSINLSQMLSQESMQTYQNN